MITAIEMEKDQSLMTEQILNLTLEIIYLLTGERCPPLMSGDHMTITVHCGSLNLEGQNKNKILDVTYKMIGLLTGEGEEQNDYNIVIKEECKEEDEKYGVMETPHNRNPPEQYPHPLYSQDPTQGEDLRNMEDEVEETYIRNDQQYTEEAGMMGTYKEEETPIEISTGLTMEKRSKNYIYLSPDSQMKDVDIRDCVRGWTKTSPTNRGPHSADRPLNDSQLPHSVLDGVGILGEKISKQRLSLVLPSQGGQKRYSCNECGKCFSQKSHLVTHERSHTGEKPFSCPQCGKCFLKKSHLVTHHRSHTGEKPYSCPQCGKCFSQKSTLVTHVRSHTGEKPYSCPECGKCFSQKSTLVTHQTSHTGMKPYSCPECKKSYAKRSHLVIHQRSHTGEKPFSCPECGKCFFKKSHLVTHHRSHTGEKPYSCPQCGKCFSQTSTLVTHRRSHTGEKPYSCTECGKCFSKKSHLVTHQRSHTRKKLYQNNHSHLNNHTGE